MERSEAKERKGLIDASPIFPGWRWEGGGMGEKRGGGDVTLLSRYCDCTKGSRFAEEMTSNL